VQAPHFEIVEIEPTAVRRLQQELGVSGALAQVLARRGLADPESARAFLAASEAHPYGAFAGIDEALATIRRHVQVGSRITVHGDYDVDGVCSTALLVRALRGLSANVDWYLPDRAGDGYGLSMDTIARLRARGTSLLVSVDCGITAVEEVAAARALGMDVVISDHHGARPDGRLPDAPIVHPTVCGYPFAHLCATAVAYKLAEGLAGREPTEDLDLVALATIADVVPLVGENRALARRGLRALRGTLKPGLRALMAVAHVDPARCDERTVAFALAPRLNAAGRLYRADAALELLLTEDRGRAGLVARELDRVNHERREIERAIKSQAEAQIAELGAAGDLPPALVLAGEGWHAGVIGIVAARLADVHHRPVVLVALEGDRGRGSGRSGCERFDLLAGLAACGEHLRRYGGHRAAAGVEIDRDRMASFAAALGGYAQEALAGQQVAPVERVDAVVDGSELGIALAEELQGLAPFGQGNPPVALMLAEASFTGLKPMGEGRHLRFTVNAHGARARGVAFNTGARLPVSEGEPALATFALEVNEWRGVSEPRLVLRHATPLVEALSGARRAHEEELVLFA
jgi:single-stranded-DNA-specific exonuclease